MNWKVAVTLLLILSATAIATTTIYLNAKPAHSQLEAPEIKTIHKNLILYGDPVGGPGGPH